MLTQDENRDVRKRATDALGQAFSQVPDKTQAWQDLHRLTQDGDSSVRGHAASALGKVFIEVTDKDKAWQDLHRLTQDENRDVRWRATDALGQAFSQVPDKTQAWQDLYRLTQDDDSNVRMYAHHSLGRATIFKAIEAKDNDILKKELEAAVDYFEKASHEGIYSPSRFCYPFYRSYLAITFQEATEEEVQSYLAQARDAVGGSKHKNELLKAVENLAEALWKSQRLKDRPINEIASKLNIYKWYCNRAAEYMDIAEDEAPRAVKLMKKCNPLLEERIQATITEIQERAKQIYLITHKGGTELEKLGTEINMASKSLSFTDIHETQRCISRIAFQLKEFCKLLPEGEKELICEAVKEIGQATEFPDKLVKIELALAYVSSAVGASLGADVRTKQKIWNIPFLRNTNFIGREDIINGLYLALNPKGRLSPKQVLCGMGGVGKTQVALEYIYRYSANYDTIWWLRSGEPSILLNDYVGLADALELNEEHVRDHTLLVNVTKSWLENNPNWLLIFDDVQNPKDIMQYFPTKGSGHIIITSRSLEWKGIANIIHLNLFNHNDSIRFILNRTGQNDEVIADKLAIELGDHPLALEQTGAYIEETGLSLRDYLEMFRDYKRLIQKDDNFTNYSAIVSIILTISLKAIACKSPSGADLLKMCSFLGSDGIPRSLLSMGSAYLSEPLASAVSNELKFDSSVAALREYSLMNIDEDKLFVHRLVQAATRDLLSEGNQKSWAEAAIKLLNDVFAFDPNNVETWKKCSSLLPHVLAASGYAENLKVVPDKVSQLLSKIGLYLQQRNELSEARSTLDRALKIDEAAFGPDHLNVAAIVNNLGGVLKAQGDLESAKRCYERALKIDEAAFGPDHPEVAIDINNLGGVLKAQGDLEGAMKCYERALDIDETAFGPDDPNVATMVSNLGGILKDQGDLEGAKKCFQRAIGISEKSFGSDHPTVAVILSNLGGVLQAQGDFDEAKKHYLASLKIFTTILGENHPSTIRARRNIRSLTGELT